MMQTTRLEKIKKIFPSEPSFRFKQIETAFFNPKVKSWSGITTIPKKLREQLEETQDFNSLQLVHLFNSKKDETKKAILKTIDEKMIETVLMPNSRGYWTICISTQVGCAMNCSFCSTGKMGLTRNLSSDEIVDQFLFWQRYLDNTPELEQRVSNIVYMGMGEPLANYENVKKSLNTIITHTEIGNTKITVSTVGILPRLEQILTDEDWPHIKLAISLHSADIQTRKKIIPSSYADFLPKLSNWAKRYREKFGNRRHYLTFEYIMLKDVNDSKLAAKQLAKFVRKIGNAKVNLIPYNDANGEYLKTNQKQIEDFAEILEKKDIQVTVRESKGDDISAACGQLANKITNK